jgi:ion channel-forming bestrophin family protein
VLQLKSFVGGQDQAMRRMALRQAAWCYCLGQSLRGLSPTENLSGLLCDDDIQELSRHSNKPLGLLSQHAADLTRWREQGKLELFAHCQMDSTLVRLCDAQGRAERIKSTVFPRTYRMFLHGIIYLFVVTLSLSLKDVPFQFELPLLLSISAPFFLLEKSATHMQDPFENRPTDTAMTAIARNIEINIRQLISDDQVPAPWQPSGFYLS